MPALDHDLRLLERVEDLTVEQLVAQPAFKDGIKDGDELAHGGAISPSASHYQPETPESDCASAAGRSWLDARRYAETSRTVMTFNDPV
jgi:hypothetical protein